MFALGTDQQRTRQTMARPDQAPQTRFEQGKMFTRTPPTWSTPGPFTACSIPLAFAGQAARTDPQDPVLIYEDGVIYSYS